VPFTRRCSGGVAINMTITAGGDACCPAYRPSAQLLLLHIFLRLALLDLHVNPQVL
jgi:hypothetical protein